VNINYHACKIMTASFKEGIYNFDIIGFSRDASDYAIVEFNGNAFQCNLAPSSKEKVTFSPMGVGVFNWSTSLSVPADLVNDFENIFYVSVNGERYPVCVWLKSAPLNLVMPPLDNIKRVSGAYANENTYRNEGRTEYLRYKKLINEFAPRGKSGQLLDWGVGCARVAQHFANDGNHRVFGADIDKVNIDWCSANLLSIDVSLVPLTPPTKFHNSEFDIIISSSVLSHLIPGYWDEWLNEIFRLLKRDGVAFLSFHGDHSNAVMIKDKTPARLGLIEHGFVDFSPSMDLGESLTDYYRNVFYTDTFARQLFEKHFVIVDFVPGILSGSQTVAILRKKKQ
jgi:SAM-dependent methyltransferase